jgi:hypothetical protein
LGLGMKFEPGLVETPGIDGAAAAAAAGINGSNGGPE